MPTYTTEYVKNITSGEPFIFEVTDEALARLERRKRFVEAGQAPPLGNSVAELIENFEFSLLPTFKDVLKIFIEDGFSTDLVTKILRDFGANESFVQELLRNEKFLQQVRPWFAGIACDGERAIRTLKIVYSTALACWKNGAMDVSCREERPRASLPDGKG